MKFLYYFDCPRSEKISAYVAEIEGIDVQFRYQRKFLKSNIARKYCSVEFEVDLHEFSLNEFVISYMDKKGSIRRSKKWLFATCDGAILELDYDEIQDEDVPCLLFQLMYMKKVKAVGREIFDEIVSSIG